MICGDNGLVEPRLGDGSSSGFLNVQTHDLRGPRGQESPPQAQAHHARGFLIKREVRGILCNYMKSLLKAGVFLCE